MLQKHIDAVDKYCKTIKATRMVTALYGSQNYNLATETSDIDTKSIIIPDLFDWLWSTEGRGNTTIELPEYGGHVELKPVVAMFKQFLKGNINFLEILITPYYDAPLGWNVFWDDLRNHVEDFAHYHLEEKSQVWLGYIKQMLNRTYTNPNYDNYNTKALMHAMRLRMSYDRFFKLGYSFAEAIDMSDYRNGLLEVKKGCYPFKYVQQTTDDINLWILREKENKVYDGYTFDAEAYLRDIAMAIFQRQKWILERPEPISD